MRASPAALALLLLAALPPALAEAPAPAATRLNLVHESSHLSGGLSGWTETTLRLARTTQPRQVVEAHLTRTRRFGLEDTELGLGASLPVAAPLTLNLHLTHSPTHRVLPRHSLAAGAVWAFRPAWLLHGNWKTTRYDGTTVDHASVMLEHYFGPFSAATIWHHARALGQTTRAYELRAAWYYGDRSSIGALASSGDEAVQVGADALALARVRALALIGAHDLGGPWLLRYGVHRTRQGQFYTRSGASLGVQYAF